MNSSIFSECAVDYSFPETQFIPAVDVLAQLDHDEAVFDPDVPRNESLPSAFQHRVNCSDWSLPSQQSHISLSPTFDSSTSARRHIAVDKYIAERSHKLGGLGSRSEERPTFDMSIRSPSPGTPIAYYRHGNTSELQECALINHTQTDSVDDDWSAFQYTLSPLEPGSSVNSFLSVIPWNNRTEASRQEHHSSCTSDVQKRHLSSIMPQQVFTSFDDGRKSSFQMSTSPGVNAMGDVDTDAGVRQFPAVSFADSRFLTNNSFDPVSITSAETQTLKDANIASGKQVVDGRFVKKDFEHSTNSRVQYSVNKSTKGKENIEPSGNRPELHPRRNTDDLPRSGVATCSTADKHSIECLKNQESGGKDQWRSPPRRSANNAKNLPSVHEQLLPRERTVSNKNKDGSNTNLDEAYKRSSSTPVKDRSPQQPIRFRRQRHGSSSDEERKCSSQHSGEVSVRGSKIGESVTRLNERSSTMPAAQRMVSQDHNRDTEMNADFMEQSFAALSTQSLSNYSLISGNTTFESTTFMSLPRCVATESVNSVSSEVGTQTSFLFSSNDRKNNSRLTSGEKLVPGHTNMSVIAPTELRIDSVCCVGLSSHGTLPLHNPSVHWMQVQLTVSQISIDGQPADHHVSPFSVKPKVTIDPNSTESIKVLFAPRTAGIYVAQLSLLSGPVDLNQSIRDKLPVMVTLQAIAENPSIELSSSDGSEKYLRFTALPWGCETYDCITLVNKGLSTIPVRLVITSIERLVDDVLRMEEGRIPKAGVTLVRQSSTGNTGKPLEKN